MLATGIERRRKSIFDIKAIYLWTAVYLLAVYCLTLTVGASSWLIYALYAVMALPFYRYLDKFAILCFSLSTIAYYFAGADEAVLSLYSILSLFLLVKAVTELRFTLRVVPLFLLLALAAVSFISFNQSPFHYSTGLYAMLYNLVVCGIVLTTLQFERDTLLDFFPFVAAIQICFYCIVVLIHGGISLSGTSIDPSVSHNTFGLSCAVLGTVLCVKALSKKGATAYKLLWVVSVVITLISGSRNAFLGLVVASAFSFLMIEHKNGRGVTKYFRATFIVLVCVIVVYSCTVLFGIDLSRFNYVELFESGGTNRSYLWSMLIPVIAGGYLFFGYGPGHHCSSLMIEPLVNRVYAHSHNVFIECFGELGIVGLASFVSFVAAALVHVIRKYLRDSAWLVILSIMVELLVNGIGESMFADMVLWLVLAFAISKPGWEYDGR